MQVDNDRESEGFKCFRVWDLVGLVSHANPANVNDLLRIPNPASIIIINDDLKILLDAEGLYKTRAYYLLPQPHYHQNAKAL